MVTVSETILGDIRDRLIRVEERLTGLEERMRGLEERMSETNRRIDETNRRIDETNRRIDSQTESLRRELRSDINRQTFLILGFGAALIVSVVTAVVFG